MQSFHPAELRCTRPRGYVPCHGAGSAIWRVRRKRTGHWVFHSEISPGTATGHWWPINSIRRICHEKQAHRLIWDVVARSRVRRRCNAYQAAPTAATLALATLRVAVACGGRSPEIRSRSGTPFANVRIGQPRSTAILRSARSGLTDVGWPTSSSRGRSVIESEYA